jgi:HAD superfamily hydrolase (TIGR01509 family)
MLKALIFDVDGTMADTEQAHRDAFNWAFEQEGLDWHWDQPLYTQLLEISGGKERLLHYWRQQYPDRLEFNGHGLRDTIDRLHAYKTAAYEQAVRDGAVSLRPGVMALVEDAQRHALTLAIATTTSPVNIAALLRTAMGPDWQFAFAVIEDGVSAPRKKPAPDVYLQTLRRLRMEASDCVAIEDSANGLNAARAAGLKTVITPNSFTAHHDFSGAMRVVPDLSGVTVDELNQWVTESLV